VSASDLPAYQRSPAEVIAGLHSDAVRGLTTTEARQRLAHYGLNELETAPPLPRWRRFLAQFTNPLVLLLLGATVISMIAWLLEGAEALPYEAIAIVAIVIVNALIGFFQEERAEAAVEALKQMTTATATVLRDGRPQQIPSRELAPGDILLIEEGNAITADAAATPSNLVSRS
jgi:Ca2+-transporting ATPase